jgi:hypothetical protein
MPPLQTSGKRREFDPLEVNFVCYPKCLIRGGAEGIRTDGHRGRSEISSYSSLRQSMRPACSRPRLSIAIDAARLGCSLLALLAGVAGLAPP